AEAAADAIPDVVGVAGEIEREHARRLGRGRRYRGASGGVAGGEGGRGRRHVTGGRGRGEGGKGEGAGADGQQRAMPAAAAGLGGTRSGGGHRGSEAVLPGTQRGESFERVLRAAAAVRGDGLDPPGLVAAQEGVDRQLAGDGARQGGF